MVFLLEVIPRFRKRREKVNLMYKEPEINRKWDTKATLLGSNSGESDFSFRTARDKKNINKQIALFPPETGLFANYFGLLIASG